MDQGQDQPRGPTTRAPATTCLQTRVTQTTTWTEEWIVAWTGREVLMPGPDQPREDFQHLGGREGEGVQDIIPWIVTEMVTGVIETLCP